MEEVIKEILQSDNEDPEEQEIDVSSDDEAVDDESGDEEEEVELIESIFPLGSCTVRNSLRMEDEQHSKQAREEVLLALNTKSSRDPDIPCVICYYDSAADESSDDEETKTLEHEFARPTVIPVCRYAGLCICDKGEGSEGDDEFQAIDVCQHRFHTVCLYKWMKADRGGFTCPICRGGLEKQRLRGIPELFITKPQYVVKMWSSGKIREEYFELNGMREGLYESYYLNGDLERTCTYHQNEMHGIERYYNAETGKMSSEVEFNHGKKHGWSRWFTSNGDLIGEAHYKNGIKSGPKREWFTDRPGRLMNLEHYLDGKRHGLFMRWSFRGELVLYGVYRDGEKDGRFIRWYDETHTIKIKEFYINGNKHGRSAEYYRPERNARCQEGVPKEIGYFSHGVPVGVWESYWSNGQVKIRTEYNDVGKMDGLHREWNRFGRCVKRFRYENGECDGVCETFDESSGQQLETGTYRRGQLHGLYVLRHKGINRPKLIRVFDQGNDIVMKRFNRAGQVVQTVDNRPRRIGHPGRGDVITVQPQPMKQYSVRPRFLESER
jgi:antitoxin component YwqK of YwqJK toxin-antitoxin module